MLTYPYAPYFDPHHTDYEGQVMAFATRKGDRGDVRKRILDLGIAGLLQESGMGEVRSIALRRGILAYHDPLDDLAFIIQELACYPLEKLNEDVVLPGARAGIFSVAFAMTEPEAGSDVTAMQTVAEEDENGEHFLTGVKHFISNAPVADWAIVFARFNGKIACFLVPNPVAEPQAVAGHSIGRFVFDHTYAELLHEHGLPLALGALERCRPTVGMAAWGMAKRAFDLTCEHLKTRIQFGRPLADDAVVRLRIADMAVDLEQAALTSLWAAWSRDHALPNERTTGTSAIGKLAATEACGRVLDQCVQLWGAAGVEESSPIQQLWRGARALRIYEGSSDVLRGLIAAEALRG